MDEYAVKCLIDFLEQQVNTSETYMDKFIKNVELNNYFEGSRDVARSALSLTKDLAGVAL